MGSGKKLTAEEMGRIKSLKEAGCSLHEMARRINRSRGVIRNYLADPENYGKRQKGGVKTATTERERRQILRIASNSTLTARQIATQVGTSASIRTVQRVLKQSPNLRRKKMKRKPALKEHHMNRRMEFARQHMSWSSEWQNVAFTDEKRFCLDGPDGYSFYFHDLRKEEQYLHRRPSAYESVMVWGAVTFNGVVELVVLQGKQSAKNYKNLLQNQKLRIEEKIENRNWILQQDNAPIHTARIVREWFSEQRLQVLDWPPLSPDLNIIENLWGYLSRQVYANGRQFQNKTDLITVLKEEWDQIPLDYCRALYSSIPNRIFEVIRVNGKHTHY